MAEFGQPGEIGSLIPNITQDGSRRDDRYDTVPRQLLHESISSARLYRVQQPHQGPLVAAQCDSARFGPGGSGRCQAILLPCQQAREIAKIPCPSSPIQTNESVGCIQTDGDFDDCSCIDQKDCQLISLYQFTGGPTSKPIGGRFRWLGRDAVSSVFTAPRGPIGQCIFLSKAADLSQTADRESPAEERG
jgi:hypothetical protein